MHITRIETLTTPYSRGTWLDDTRVSTPLSYTSRLAERRSSWRGPGSDLVRVLIRTSDDGVFGIGEARGGEVAAALIDSHLSALLLGRDISGVEATVRDLRMAALPYAAGQLSAMACSALELALWDAAARALGVPLVQMLGGAADDRPRYYLTAPDAELLVGAPAALLADAQAVKIPARYGPADGPRGLHRMLDELAVVRDAVPDGIPLAIDCFMSWDVAYAQRFAAAAAAAAADLDIAWIEEPVLPSDLEGYRELRQKLGPIAVAGGEHLSSLRDGLRFVSERCADLIQPDVTWCGGLTVAQTIGRATIEQGLVFAPHGGAQQPWTVHLLATFGASALLEVILGVDGTVSMPSLDASPGVGITIEAAGFR